MELSPLANYFVLFFCRLFPNLAWLLVLLLVAGSLPSLAAPKHDSPVPAGLRHVLDVEDPISTSAGSYHFTQPLLDLGGGPLVLSEELFYSSDGSPLFFPHLPPKFQLSHQKIALQEQLDPVTNRNLVKTQLPRGGELIFRESSPGQWVFFDNEQFEYALQETTDFFYLTDPERDHILFFEKIPEQNGVTFAFLTRQQDRNGNALVYTNGADPLDEGVQSITDNLGRSLSFTYNTVGDTDPKSYLQKITDHTGREVTFVYEDDPVDNPGLVTLRKIVDPAGSETVFTYDKQHRITAKRMPEGNTPVTQTYVADEFSGRVLSQTDADGQATTFELRDPIPGLGDTHFVAIYPDGAEEHYHHSNNGSIATALTDALGQTILWRPDKNNRNRTTAAKDREGNTIAASYHPASGKIASQTNEAGFTTAFTYTPKDQAISNPANGDTISTTFHELTRIEFPDGTSRQFSYDDHGNTLTVKDRAGNTTTFTYNGRGQILTRTNPEGGVETLTYDAAGLLASRTDSDTGITTFQYDPRSNLTGVTYPDTNTQSFTYDSLDRLVTTTDEDGVTISFTYDANGNVLTETLAASLPEEQVTTFEYDDQDRRTKTIDPNGGETSHTFTHFDRPAVTTFPDGGMYQYSYDRRRNLVRLTDENGDVTRLTYTRREHIASFTSPLERTQVFERDPRGPINQFIDSSGDRLQFEYDATNRVTAITDGLDRKTTFSYDGEGRVVTRNEPTLGSTTYQHDGNGFLEELVDPKGGSWDFIRSPMGRVTGLEDPDDHAIARSYDDRGRLQTQTHPDGVTETFAYHPDSTVASRTFSDGLTLTYSYDALNRLTGASRELDGTTDTHAQTFDSRDNITSTTLNALTSTATFDVLNRLKTVTYPGGMVVTYTYDSAGLLTRVEDSLSESFIDYEYDADRQLTKVTRSNGQTTAIAYDEEALPIRVTHSNGAEMTYTLNRADEPTSIKDLNFPLVVAAVIANSTSNLSFDPSSNIDSPGFSSDDRGRRTADPARSNYTWDSDDRLVSCTRDGTTVTFRYDALGRLASRSEGAVTTNYLYNSAIELSPILGEQENGSFTRFYVTLPDGSLAYSVEDPGGTSSPRFYHFGRTGNTRFLTDATGSVTDSYLYGAFGRVIGRNGTSTQIYTFVGRAGVRADHALDLLHMRDRYYDPATRRFVSRDPIFEELLGTGGLAANPFQYALNNPLRFIDPTGRRAEADVLTVLKSGSVIAKFLDLITRFSKEPETGFKGLAAALFLKEIENGIRKLPRSEKQLLRAAFLGDSRKTRHLLDQGVSIRRDLFTDEFTRFSPFLNKQLQGAGAVATIEGAGFPVGPMLPLLVLVLRWNRSRRQKKHS